MKDRLLKLSVKLQSLLMSEDGQDLVEYALVVGLIAFGAVSAMQTLSTDINGIFTNIGTTLTTSVP